MLQNTFILSQSIKLTKNALNVVIFCLITKLFDILIVSLIIEKRYELMEQIFKFYMLRMLQITTYPQENSPPCPCYKCPPHPNPCPKFYKNYHQNTKKTKKTYNFQNPNNIFY